MLKQIRLPRIEKAVFVCQITESSLKAVKFLLYPQGRRQPRACESLPLAAANGNKNIAERLRQLFKKLDYKDQPVILSLPCNLATMRYLRIPSYNPQEIEKIVSLQSQQYLPYPADELTSGFSVASIDREGYSHVNIVVVHQDMVRRYLDILKEARIWRVKIVLSSYGLRNLYCITRPGETGPVMLVDAGSQETELAVVAGSQLVFSRAFKFGLVNPGWAGTAVAEITKTHDAYLKGVSREALKKIVVLGVEREFAGLAAALKNQTSLSLEFWDYPAKINLAADLLTALAAQEKSFASLIGLGLEDTAESLNLIPRQVKEAERLAAGRRRRLQSALLVAGTMLIFSAAVLKTLDNKQRCLARYKTELDKITKQARPLEDMEKRIELLEASSQKRLSSLEMLYELGRVMPKGVSLIDLSYEENGQVILRGEAGELASVFTYAAGLERAKVRYATKRKTPSGEIIDFEISWPKK